MLFNLIPEALKNQDSLTSSTMTAEAAMRLCDRRRGIGADGVLSVLPARGGAAAYMPQALPWDVRGLRSERTRNGCR